MPISMVGRYGKNKLNSLRVMSNVKVFAMQDGRPDGRLHEHDSLYRSIYLYG